MTRPEPQPPVGADPARMLELEGVWNFRDLGGYRARDGRALRWRRLFRADGLDRLTEPPTSSTSSCCGCAPSSICGPATRWPGGASPRRPARSAWYHLPMLDVLPPREDYDAWVGARPRRRAVPGHDLRRRGDRAPASCSWCAMRDRYPLVFHCFAGKDRTGILTALVLGLLGVADDDIAADYALSAAAMHHLLAWLRAQYQEAATELERLESSAAAIVAAEPETMAAFLRQFRAVYGSFEAYAASVGHPDAAARLAGSCSSRKARTARRRGGSGQALDLGDPLGAVAGHLGAPAVERSGAVAAEECGQGTLEGVGVGAVDPFGRVVGEGHFEGHRLHDAGTPLWGTRGRTL